MSWLENLKAGDEVVVENCMESRVETVEVVNHISVLVAGRAYSKQSGASDAANPRQLPEVLREAAPEALAKMRDTQHRRDLEQRCGIVFSRELTTDQLERICAILDEIE